MLASLRADRRRRARGAGRDAGRRLRRRLDVPAAASVLSRPGSGRSGRRASSSSATLLVGAGFFVYCLDVLEQTTSDATAGSHARSAGSYLRGREAAGAAAAGDRRHRRRDRRPDLVRGRIDDPRSACSAAPTTTRVGIDALVAKNLVYFFGHSIANLTIYLGRRRDLRARAPLRRPPVRDDQGVRRRLGWARSSSSRPPTRTTCTWTSSSRTWARDHLRDRLLRRR